MNPSINIIVAIVLTTVSLSSAAEPLDIGSRRQLFCDDYLIASRGGAKRILHQPQKVNGGRPVLRIDRPWEELGAPILGAVLRDEGKFRMWYRGGGGGPNGGVWCYAESRDGLTWEKPSLELVEYKGGRANNIFVVGQPQAFTPFVDPNESDRTRRYKSAVNSLRIDTALAHSPDGLRWTQYRNGAAITGRASDTISQVLWDPYARVYRLYTRTDYGAGKTGEVRGTRDMIADADADLSDPNSWRKVREWCLGWETKPPVVADGKPATRKRDSDYHRQRQLYSVNGWVHEGVQFALIWALETGADDRGVRELMNAYLATTRGEEPWNLDWVYRGEPLIRRGQPGTFDCRWIQPAPNVVTWNDRHWLFYVGLARSHAGEWSPQITGAKGGIGLATIRRDGFFSLRAGEREVLLTTKPLKFAGDRLSINAVTALQGSVRVEIQDAAGFPFANFALADNTPFTGDGINRVIGWKSSSDVSRLAGKTVRLRIALRRADLYSLRFENQE